MTNIEDHNFRIFELSWHYKFIILPLIVGIITIGLFQDHWRSFDKYIIPIICLYVWWEVLFTAHKIEIENKKISFFRIVGKIEVQTEDVVEIEHWLYFVKISHKNGKVRVTGLINNFQGMLSTIKSLNQEVVIKNWR